jgi:hypothetical protein
LVLLVVTGLASQVSKDTLSGKERKRLLTELKESKASFLLCIKGLNENQLNFKSTSKCSIKEIIQRQALAEINLWQMADTASPQTFQYEKQKLTETNEKAIALDDAAQPVLNPFGCKKVKTFSVEKATKIFIAQRNNVIKYVQTTTDDVNKHFAQTSFGKITLYQILKSIPSNTEYYIQQAQSIKASPHFPK